MTRVLVVGGAGYIGSVCTALLRARGIEAIVFDDLSSGHLAAVTGPLVLGDIRDRDALRAALNEGRFDAVMHFAALIQVGESVLRPLDYFDVNVGGTLNLLQAMADAGVRCLVFSSTCAIYGDPQRLPLDEGHPIRPVSPYGETKAMVERILDACRARGQLRAISLRYFNAAGATSDGLLGESHPDESHLIPLALAAALGRRPPLSVLGTDYDTRDGSAIRDYIHVVDLAEAHLLALDRLLAGAPGRAYNVGTGTGHTVREVLSSVERVLGRPVPHSDGPRRPGDAPILVADSRLARLGLGWAPRHSDLDEIIRTAARWATEPRY